MWNIVSVIVRVKPETKLIIILSYTSHRLQRNAKGPEVNSINEFESLFPLNYRISRYRIFDLLLPLQMAWLVFRAFYNETSGCDEYPIFSQEWWY